MADLPLFRDRAMTPEERRKIFGAKVPKKGLHAAEPGSGPEGQICGTCEFLARLRFSKTYLKCELTRRAWTGGAGTDVKAGDPACSKWKAK